MELVGEVQANTMLKISLDAGSYLVEAKALDGKCLKKYELKVNYEDNQVLQDLAIVNASLNETVEALRSDSTLRFYNQRAVFCYNGKFGYINSQYKVIIEPIYSFAGNFFSNRTFVRRTFPDGEMATLIDTDGNICLDQWYNYIGSNDKTILLKRENVFSVLSCENYSFIEEYHDAGYDGKSDLIPVHKEFGVDDMYGYIDKTGVETIPFIYDNVWNFDDEFAKVKRFGMIHFVNRDGTLYYKLKPYTSATKDYVISKEDSCKIGFCFEPMPATEFWTKLICNKWCIVSSKVEMFRDANGDYTGDYEFNKNEFEIVYEFDRLFYFNGEIASGRINGICVLLKLVPSIVEYNFDANKIIPNTYYDGFYHIRNIVVLKNGKYGILDLKQNIIVPFDYDDIQLCPQEDYELTKYAIVSKKSKYSIIDTTTGELKIPLEYDSIDFNNSNIVHNETICYFAKKRKNSFSCLNYKGNIIVDIVCEHFKYECIVEKDDDRSSLQILYLEKIGKHGLCLIYHPCDMYKFYKKLSDIEILYLEPIYDECVLCNSNSRYAVLPTMGLPYVAVRHDSKWGIIDGSMFHHYIAFVDDSWELSANPNLGDLVFKYASLTELQNDADLEFLRRHEKHTNYNDIEELSGQESDI